MKIQSTAALLTVVMLSASALAESQPHVSLHMEVAARPPIARTGRPPDVISLLSFQGQSVHGTVILYYGLGAVDGHGPSSAVQPLDLIEQPWTSYLQWSIRDQWGKVINPETIGFSVRTPAPARQLKADATARASFELTLAATGSYSISARWKYAKWAASTGETVIDVYRGDESREIHAEFLRDRTERLLKSSPRDTDGAIAALRELSALTPTDFRPVERMADLLLGRQSLDDSRRLYSRASEILIAQRRGDPKPPPVIQRYWSVKGQKFAAFERAFQFASQTKSATVELVGEPGHERFVVRDSSNTHISRSFN